MPKGICVPIFSITAQKMQKLKKLPKNTQKWPKIAPPTNFQMQFHPLKMVQIGQFFFLILLAFQEEAARIVQSGIS